MGNLKGRSLREIAATESKRRAATLKDLEDIKSRSRLRDSKFSAAYMQGMSIAAIAKYYKVSVSRVRGAVKGVRRLQKEAVDRLIVGKFIDGVCSKCIAVQHEVSYATVKRKTKGKERKRSIVCYFLHHKSPLTPDDKLELDRISSLRHSILRLTEDGKTADEIAHTLNISRAEVTEYSE